MVISPDAQFGAMMTIMLVVLGFFFRREREFGTIQASLRALHKRIDRIERKENGKESVEE